MKIVSWRAEDFSSSPRRPKILGDFWDQHVSPEALVEPAIIAVEETVCPVTLRSDREIAPSANGYKEAAHEAVVVHNAGPTRAQDFWDPIPNLGLPPQAQAATETWIDRLSFSSYDPAANENPFVDYAPVAGHETLAKKCAGAILKLACASDTQRRQLTDRFVALFIDYPHPSSFLAIANLVKADALLDDILAAYDLRLFWVDNPSYSLVRGRRGAFFIPDGRQCDLTWKLAHKLVAKSRGTPPETLIDPSWVDEWMDLPTGDELSYQFLRYVEARIDAFHDGALDAPVIDRRYLRWMSNEAPNRLRPTRWYEGDSAVRDLVTIDGFRIFNDHSRTASLVRWYSNDLGQYDSATNRKQVAADV